MDLMLGKGKLAELRALARTHKLATGSQTVPNSVVEIAAAQGRSPPQGLAPLETLPAPQRKKLILRKPKRKTPQVVQEDEDEDDEATEDGLVTKRKRVAPSSPPALPTPTLPSPPVPTPSSPPAPTPPVQATPLAVALPAVESNEPYFMENPPSASTPFISAGEGPPSTASIAEAAPGGHEGAHNSPILITESPTSPPRQEAPLAQPIQEGGGESQHQAPSAPPPTAVANPSPLVKQVWGPFTAKLKMMAEDLPSIITKAVKSSNKKLQDEISTLQEENRLIRIEAEKLSCNLMMAEIDHSRVEDAMSAELRASMKADAAKVENLEKRSADREVLLGKVEKEKDDAVDELAKAREENEKIAAELAQARGEGKKVADDLAQARGETEELKKRADELKQQTEGLKQQNKELELSCPSSRRRIRRRPGASRLPVPRARPPHGVDM
ncbi:uncharacterized protein [Phaseolus vulgaris]|uniref:uncharacterized protein n=1 Tax=Phaseolus vulgaris TaxID=3885 RepID=UPI0035CA2259